MKRLCFLWIAYLLFIALSPSAAAVSYADAFKAERVYEEAPINALEAAEGLLPEGGGEGLETGFANLVRMAGKLFPKSIGAELRTLLALFLVTGICCMLGSFSENIPAEFVTAAGTLAIAALTLTGFGSILTTAKEAMTQLSLYSKTLIGTLAALTAASGAPASAVATSAAAVLFGDLLMTLYERLLVPMLYMYAALLTANAAFPRLILERVAAFIKWMLCGILTMTLVVYTAYLNIAGVVHGQADQMAVRTTRAALGGSVPVVGRIIADASEMVLAGAGLIRGSVGVFGLIAVLGIVLSPVLVILARYLIFKLGGALIGTMGENTLGRYVDNLAGLFSMTLAVLCSQGFLLIITLIAFMQAGG